MTRWGHDIVRVAQWRERLLETQEAVGSTPTVDTKARWSNGNDASLQPLSCRFDSGSGFHRNTGEAEVIGNRLGFYPRVQGSSPWPPTAIVAPWL